MRISDWRSDVCSAVLARRPWWPGDLPRPRPDRGLSAARPEAPEDRRARLRVQDRAGGDRHAGRMEHRRAAPRRRAGRLRSEEHTSELSSLMRISYAVLCLKNKIPSLICPNLRVI